MNCLSSINKMVTHTANHQKNSIYFITFTCYKWLPLIFESNSYNSVYKWFYYIQDCTKILGYVIMPNHVHLLIYLVSKEKTLNQIVGEGKRFLAYRIVKKLKEQNKSILLEIMSKGVTFNERLKKRKHRIFKPSFDVRICNSEDEVIQTLDYIHENPVSKKWSLVDDFTSYEHSSAAFYVLNKPSRVPITHYNELFYDNPINFD